MDGPGIETRIKEESSYKSQRALVDQGYFRPEFRSRADVIKDHLIDIDPTFDKWIDKFGPNKGEIKDISRWEYFSPEVAGDKVEKLLPEDLVMVHLTDSFPEDGIIRTTNHFRPEILRFSIHFTLNGPVVEEQQFSVGNWPKRKYAVLVPFKKAQERIESFGTGDTFVVDDFKLPEGSEIITGRVSDIPKDVSTGNAKVAIENYGTSPWDYRKAVFRSILAKGYCPMRQFTHGWEMRDWGDRGGSEVINSFIKDNGLKGEGAHVYHWSSDLERQSILLSAARDGELPLEEYLKKAKSFAVTAQSEGIIPSHYIDKLNQLIEAK